MTAKRDCVLKLERARSHLEDLKRQLSKWTDSGHHDVFNEPDPERGQDCFRVRVISDQVPSDPFGVLIGDVLHNLRGSLDHLAYALAAQHTKVMTEDIAKRSEFPIIGDERNEGIAAVEQRYGNDFARKVKGIAPHAQAIIKSLQPYHAGKNFARDNLWRLHELSNIDKHRLLLIVAASNVAAGFRPGMSRNYTLIDASVYPTIIKGDTVVMRYRAVPQDPSQQMHVEFDPILQIAFDGPAIVHGEGLIKTLKDIYDYIGGRVFGLLGKFL